MTPEERLTGHVGFARAPEGWDWAAQARDGTWYWFRVRPAPDAGKGDWIVGRNDVLYAGDSEANPSWDRTLRHRSQLEVH